MKGFLAISALLVAGSTFAQVQTFGGPGEPPPGIIVRVSVDQRVKALTYEAEAIGLFTPEGQEGSYLQTFHCSATVEGLPPGWSIVGYSWGPQWAHGDLALPFGVLTFPMNSSGSAAIGTAWSAGWGYISCFVTVRNELGEEHDLPGWKTVAAIGGALNVEGIEADLATWDHDDDDPTKPINLQYLGHSPVDVHPLYQNPRKGRFSPVLTQPDGTGVILNVSGPIVEIENTGAMVKFGATGPSGTGGIDPSGYFYLAFMDGEGEYASGSGFDCCDDMPDPESYKFTAHKPTTLTTELHSNVAWNEFDAFGNQTKWGWSLREWFMLKDNLGTPMPGVMIQERFDPNFDPAGANTSENFWVTGLDPAGRTIGVDHQGMQLTFEYTNPPNVMPFWRHRQLLVAGTRDPFWYPTDGFSQGWGGVRMGYWIVEKWTNGITRQKEGG